MHHKHLRFGGMPTQEKFLLSQIGKTQHQHLIAALTFSRMLNRLFPCPQGVLASFVLLARTTTGSAGYDVALQFDCDDEDAVVYADRVQSVVPRTWDKEALQDLELLERGAPFYPSVADHVDVPEIATDGQVPHHLTSRDLYDLLQGDCHAVH